MAGYKTKNKPDKDIGRTYTINLPGTMTKQLLYHETAYNKNELIVLDLIEDSRVNGDRITGFAGRSKTQMLSLFITFYKLLLKKYGVVPT
ncbi:hypothetical protein CONCODRAFT_14214 [Conidiobolus coronatus NRRL 28638]|uniref:Uncharacterized protein n=1 Tax=Conidiobolus coronatus (strain ATCC 28846 / CBS 209.66 / NRRL 28638) TaxID=796925 RepID=A0A137NPF4_CONC2|nr:hypothetical protein CONCODRAFT_14214 [Conidiobolus coronatus NRRL 28638]|eukprot:KXN64616.1 hypothetical protein CONCODRAFT_14214 [Conidiobolus coronatus NRRL 28638]